MAEAKLIGAWIYDPTKSLFGEKSQKALLHTVQCERSDDCDVYQACGSCLFASAMKHCKYGQKSTRAGYTRRASKYYEWMKKARETVEGIKPNIKSLTAWKRIFRIGDYYYLPYSHMAKGVFGRNFPLDSEWVSAADMNAQLLDEICSAKPCAEFGGELVDYQKKEVPKFIVDLKAHYPNLFEMLSDENKSRIETADHRGRKADITTCLPGEYKFGTSMWKWDGDVLTSSFMHFKPCKGDLDIRLKPKPGEGVTITENGQVGPETVFID